MLKFVIEYSIDSYFVYMGILKFGLICFLGDIYSIIKMSKFFQNRSDFQCQHRWQKVLNPELIKGPWTKEEDQRVTCSCSYSEKKI